MPRCAEWLGPATGSGVETWKYEAIMKTYGIAALTFLVGFGLAYLVLPRKTVTRHSSAKTGIAATAKKRAVTLPGMRVQAGISFITRLSLPSHLTYHRAATWPVKIL